MAGRAQLGAVLALALVVRLVNVWLTSRLPLAEYQFTWNEGDMALAWTWAGQIVAGDVLGQEGVHQFTDWMRPIAPPETWERWWGGKAVFHQAPLYAYALAAVRTLGGDAYWSVALAQLVLGLLNVALVFALADRDFGRVAAVAAGVGASCYGPALLHETLALRDTLAVTCVLACLWSLARCTDGAPRRWFVAGVLVALAVLARETTLTFVPFVLYWLVQRLRYSRRALAVAGLALASGVGLGVAPLVARNLAVGVAPWALSTRGLEGFVYGNAVGASVVGLTPPPGTQAILEQADGSVGRAIGLTLATWQGNWSGLVAHELAKLGAIFSAYEGADNASWYYFADRLPTLRWAIGFPLILGLALPGLMAPGKRADHRILAYFLLSAVLSLLYATVVGRYRLVPAAVLLVYAGGGVAWIADLARGRQWERATVVLGIAAIIVALSAWALPAAGPRHRAAEFWLAAEHLYRAGDREGARAELERGLSSVPSPRPTLPPDFVQLLRPLVTIHAEAGRHAEAAALLERVSRAHPDDPDVHELLAVLYGDALREPARAEAHREAARRLRGTMPTPDS